MNKGLSGIVVLALALLMSVPTFAQSPQPQPPVFTPGNLVVAVAGCGVYGGTCATPPVGGTGDGNTDYGDDQGSPWTLFQYSLDGTSSATFLNSLQLPQNISGANYPISNDYGSQSEGTIQLSGNGEYLTIMGYGLNAATFNTNFYTYCPGSTPGEPSTACVPENGNPAMAQSGSLTQPVAGVTGTTAVPRVAALVDANGNVNSSTVLFNIYDENDARSAYTPDGTNIYVSGQGCKTCGPTPNQIPASGDNFDNTMGVYYTPVGAINDAPTPITGNDNGPSGCTGSGCTSSEDTRMVQIYNNTLYVSTDAKPGSAGYNRSYIGTLGDPPATSLFTCTGVGGGCGTGYGPYGPAEMTGFGNTGGTGKVTITAGANGNGLNVTTVTCSISNASTTLTCPSGTFSSADAGDTVVGTGIPTGTTISTYTSSTTVTMSNAATATNASASISLGLLINISPQNFFFASPTVLYVADTGSPKNSSNNDTVCSTDGGGSKSVGDGGLQKWINISTTFTGAVTGSKTVTATTAVFSYLDVGLPISGTGIPAGTTIASVTSPTVAKLSASSTTGSNETISIGPAWSLAYTLYQGLNLVLNSDCDPNSPTSEGSLASTGLYGLAGVVEGSTVSLYATNYPNNDLVQTYLYGITDTLSTTTNPGTSFTQLDAAPTGSVFRGVSFVPQYQNGDVAITSVASGVPAGLTVTTSGTGCAPNTYTTPSTLAWTPGSSCKLSVASPQNPANTPGTQYVFSQWQDGTTNLSDTVTAPSSTATNTYTYTATFTTQYQLTTSAGTGGSVSAGGFFNAGTNATITATPSAGFYFVNFTGSTTSTSNPLILTMNAPQTITANFATQMPQSITFTVNAPASAAYGSQFTVAASASSGLAVTFTSAGSCSNSGATYTMTSGTGTCSVIANQAGNNQYSAAPQVTESVTAIMASGSGNIAVTAASAAGSIYPAQSDTLTATVTVTLPGGAPAGAGETVSFYAGSTLLGTGTLSTVDANDSSTSINITGSQLAAGSNSITAVYSGDPNYSSTTSAAITVTLLSPLVNVGSSNVGTAGPVQTLNYTFTAAMTLTAVNILTAGTPGLDFTDGGSSTCTSGAYTAGQSCVVTVAYTPTAPGVRGGAVTIFAQGSTLPLMTWYLNGVGQSGAVTIDPGTQTPITLTGTQSPAGYGSAVDGAGNVYVVDHTNNAVLKLAAGKFTQSTVVSGLSAPTAVALDGAGNLYISNSASVVMVPNENGTLNPADESTVNLSGLASARGLAVDANADLYVADATNGDVVELSSLGVQTTIASGLTSPHGVAVDAGENVYVASNNAVTQYPYGGGTPVPYGTGYNNPRGLAVDSAGAVYVVDTGNNQIVRVSPGGGSQTSLLTGISAPQGVSLDAADNLYLTTSSTLIQVNRTQAAQLNFSATNVGSTSTTQVVTVTDAGNAALQFSNLVISANFAFEPSGGTDCTSSTDLSAGGQCEIGVAFAPTVSGALTGTVSLSDDALNLASTQTVPLSGAGSKVAQSITFTTPAPASAASGSSFTVAATASSGLAVTFTSAGSCSNAGATYTMTSGTGTCSVIANQAGNNEYSAAPQVTEMVNATLASQSITFSVNAPASAAYGNQFTVAATASSGLAVAFTSAGSCSNSGATYTMTSGTGTCSVIANQAGNNQYSAAPQVTQTVNATLASQSITFSTNPPASAAYGSQFTVAAAASSGLAVAFTTSGACSNSGATYTMTSGTGTCSVIANQAGNNQYSAAPTVTKTVTAALASQSITVKVPAPASATLGSSFTIVASSTSGLAVTFSSSGGCTNSGATYTMASSGSKACTETMNAAANSNYSAAPTVVESTSVAKPITPTVSFTGAPATATYGSTFTVAASSNSTSTPTFTATGSCTINVTTLAVTMTSGTGTCTMKASWAANDVYAAATATQTTTAEKAASVITWPSPAPITYGTPLGATQLDATANVPGTFVYSPAAGKVLAAGVQSLSVKFTPTSTSDYTTVTDDVDLTVNPVGTTTTITKNTPDPSKVAQAVTVGFSVTQAITNSTKPTGTVTVTAGSGQSCSGTLSGGSGSCKITFETAGSITLTATYSGDANNDSGVSASVTQTVNQ
jgi:large repetitive protein